MSENGASPTLPGQILLAIPRRRTVASAVFWQERQLTTNGRRLPCNGRSSRPSRRPRTMFSCIRWSEALIESMCNPVPTLTAAIYQHMGVTVTVHGTHVTLLGIRCTGAGIEPARVAPTRPIQRSPLAGCARLDDNDYHRTYSCRSVSQLAACIWASRSRYAFARRSACCCTSATFTVLRNLTSERVVRCCVIEAACASSR